MVFGHLLEDEDLVAELSKALGERDLRIPVPHELAILRSGKDARDDDLHVDTLSSSLA
jgi:hypothetical protein